MTATQTEFKPMGWRRFAGNPLLERLATPHGVSQYLENINPLWSLTAVRAQVTARQQEGGDATTLVLKPNGNWRGFIAGQFVTLTVEINGKAHSRCYSISSATCNELLHITVRRKQGGLVSNFIADQLEVGTVVTLSAAAGEFIQPAGAAPLLMIAGGSGITPMMSILRSVNWAECEQPITLIYYGREHNNTLFLGELQKLAASQSAFTLHTMDVTKHGHYSPAQLNNAVANIADQHTLLCGPSKLMNAVEADYEARGLSDKLLLERFTLPEPQLPDDADTVTGDVMFSRSERYAANSGKTLLEQAEAAGLQPEFGCRRGICHACSCTKASGTVRDVITGELSAQPDETIRLCVSQPVGDVVLDI